MEKFDVIVIGTGSGSTVAQRCAQANKKTAIIDSQSFGGTCSLRGCDPKKVLVGLARVLALNEQLKGKGIQTVATSSWKDLMEFKRTFTEPKIPKIIIKASPIIPTMARNLAHLAASDRCAFVTGSIDKEKREVFDICSINSWFWL